MVMSIQIRIWIGIIDIINVYVCFITTVLQYEEVLGKGAFKNAYPFL